MECLENELVLRELEQQQTRADGAGIPKLHGLGTHLFARPVEAIDAVELRKGGEHLLAVFFAFPTEGGFRDFQLTQLLQFFLQGEENIEQEMNFLKRCVRGEKSLKTIIRRVLSSSFTKTIRVVLIAFDLRTNNEGREEMRFTSYR